MIDSADTCPCDDCADTRIEQPISRPDVIGILDSFPRSSLTEQTINDPILRAAARRFASMEQSFRDRFFIDPWPSSS